MCNVNNNLIEFLIKYELNIIMGIIVIKWVINEVKYYDE